MEDKSFRVTGTGIELGLQKSPLVPSQWLCSPGHTCGDCVPAKRFSLTTHTRALCADKCLLTWEKPVWRERLKLQKWLLFPPIQSPLRRLMCLLSWEYKKSSFKSIICHTTEQQARKTQLHSKGRDLCSREGDV
jgi:hypothetical protein